MAWAREGALLGVICLGKQQGGCREGDIRLVTFRVTVANWQGWEKVNSALQLPPLFSPLSSHSHPSKPRPRGEAEMAPVAAAGEL